ncbi:uncharacterized protein [Amphiura filiformis]|uniref:uncharacterized protein n=1 Tax=Amphiura filiformis TaxID=82378 RepID=UPI003B2140FA
MRSIDARLQKIVGDGDAEKDHIDEQMASNKHDQEFGKTCPVCGKEYSRRKQKCKQAGCDNVILRISKRPADSSPVTFKKKKVGIIRHEFLPSGSTATTRVPTKSQSPYEHIESHHPEDPIKIKARDPVFVNPNSYANMITVLQAIGKDLKVQKYDSTSKRQWAVVICDGLPYSLCTKILKETYTCSVCNAAIFRRTAMAKHVAEAHDRMLQEQQELTLEFGWVLLRIGYGHYEMNMVRSFMELNWEVFGKDLADVLSFKSLNAQRYAKACSDNHKSWEMIRVFYLGTLDELLLPYVRHCKKLKEEPTAAGYMQWKEQTVKNPNYLYMFSQVTIYVQAIMNMRGGLRRNNSSMVDAARVMHAPVFHGRNHPKYSEIEILEAGRCMGQPQEVKAFMDGIQSFSDKGSSRGEDLDFKTEVINQQSKAWVSHGVPTEEVWLRIFRNLESLEKLRSSTFKRMGLKDPKDIALDGTTHEPRDEDINAWRLHLRQRDYLNPTVTNTTKFESVSGEELCEELLMMSDIGMRRRRFNMNKLFGDVDGADTEPPRPIFVKESERVEYDDISNKTKENIKEIVDGMIANINSDSTRHELEEEWHYVQKKNKQTLVNFYNTIYELINLQGHFVVDSLSDDDIDDNNQ